MKKLLLWTVTVLQCITLCACGSQHKNVEPPALSKETLIGHYSSVSLQDPMGIYTDLLLSETGRQPADKTIISIEYDSEDELSFCDDMHKGRCDLVDDGTIMLVREAVIANDPMLKQLAETLLQESPIRFYTFDCGYLISHSAMELEKVEGDLPNGKKTNFTLYPKHISMRDYRIEFTESGICEMSSSDLTSATYHYSGTYDVNGNVISITFTSGEAYGQEYSGRSEMVLYIKDGEIYDEVYRK